MESMSNGSDHNRAGFITFMVVLAANILYFVYVSFFHQGVPANVLGNQPAAETQSAAE